MSSKNSINYNKIKSPFQKQHTSIITKVKNNKILYLALKILLPILLISIVILFYKNYDSIFSFIKRIWILIAFLGLGITFFLNKKKNFVDRVKQAYLFLYKYAKAIFYTILTILLILVTTIFIPKVTNKDYYLIISDLPSKYVEYGYTKEVIREYIDEHIDRINYSDNKNSNFTINPNDNIIKLEALGNAVYINEAVLLFRNLIGNNKTIKLHFGIDNDTLFYKGSINTEDETTFLNKESISNGTNTFSEDNIKSLTHKSAFSAIKFTHFRKLISYYRFDNDGLELLNNIKEEIDLKPSDEAYFIRVYGNRLFDEGYYSQSLDKYKLAFNIYSYNDIDDEKEFQKLVESYALNLYVLGDAKNAISFIEDKGLNNKTFKSIKGYLYGSLGEYNTSKSLYERAVDKSVLSYLGIKSDSISTEYTFFNRQNAINDLIQLYNKDGEFKKSLKLISKSYKEYNDPEYLVQKINLLNFMGENKLSAEVSQRLIDFNMEGMNNDLNNLFEKSIEELYTISNMKELKQIMGVSKTFNDLNYFEILTNLYPKNRFNLTRMFDVHVDSLVVQKAYLNYVKSNPNDRTIKSQYFDYLFKNNNEKSKTFANEIFDEQLLKYKTVNEKFYYWKKFFEYNDFSNRKIKYFELDSITGKIQNSNSDSITIANFKLNFIKNDSIYNNLKDKYFKSTLKLLELLAIENDLPKIIKATDSLSKNNPDFKNFYDKVSSFAIIDEVFIELEEKSYDSLYKPVKNIDSLFTQAIKRNYENKSFWVMWGMSKDIDGLHSQAEEKYNQVLDLKNNFNSYYRVANYFYEFDNYNLAISNFHKGLKKDSLNDTFTKDIELYYITAIDALLEGDINRNEHFKHISLIKKKFPNTSFYMTLKEHYTHKTLFYGNQLKVYLPNDLYHKYYPLFFKYLENALNYSFNINDLPNEIKTRFKDDPNFIRIVKNEKNKHLIPDYAMQPVQQYNEDHIIIEPEDDVIITKTGYFDDN